ncbi:MAG: NUDIX domain-containing protein [Actinomycetia bacterium]|nr:NUDIX domain-containing protein [Actinomycetes bacterium]MCP3910173.1 NUDIX domain-containing protein [Actinomycetes bacterium]MCP4084997.1 NUDIX domain-containing protein [Actinomycetes bacterium]
MKPQTTENPDAVELRDAATVMLVRDSTAGPEVFMLQRHLNSDFVGGAYVFPGGGVDAEDRDDDLEPVCQGRTDAETSAELGIESGGLAYWVAAVRECFEEAGVLLAYDAHGQVVDFSDADIDARFQTHRAGVDSRERRLVEVCEEESLVLATDDIHYWSHWITPVGPPRRFDTRFFIAPAPAAQVAAHDDRETVDNLWVRPADALERHRRGELEMILPTIANLEQISPFDTVADLLAAARQITDVPAILPKIVIDADGKPSPLMPGDPGYDDLPD